MILPVSSSEDADGQGLCAAVSFNLERGEVDGDSTTDHRGDFAPGLGLGRAAGVLIGMQIPRYDPLMGTSTG